MNQIRVAHRCHIAFVERDESRPLPGFMFLGNHKQLILEAIHCTVNIEKSLLARNLEPITYYLVKPLHEAGLCNAVRLAEYSDSGSSTSAQHLGPSSGKVMIISDETDDDFDPHDHGDDPICALSELDAPGEVLVGHPAASHLNALYCAMWLHYPMAALQFLRGNLEMNVDIGSCVFTNYVTPKNGAFPIDEFKSMLGTKNELDSHLESFASQSKFATLMVPTYEC